MTCEEYESMGLDTGRDASLTEARRAAGAEHAASCSRCAALRDSWEAARGELRSLADATAAAETPPRVEMRLRQQFRAQYYTSRLRRTAAAWALAAAAVLIGAMSWVNWRSSQRHNVALHSSNPSLAANNTATNSGTGSTNQQSPDQEAGGILETLVADNELNYFTLLPGVLPADTDGAAILRVRMQRGALGALGLPVNEDRAAEWIQVDLLVGNDGLPEAVRLPESQ